MSKTSKTNTVKVIIETPKGSRNKYDYDPKSKEYCLGKVLPKGMIFPYDFGFVPGTKAQDGDPIDVLVLLDDPTFCGCVIEVRLIGVIEGKQTTTKGKSIRNDRLLGISEKSAEHKRIHSIQELPIQILEQLEHFFVSYHDLDGEKFEVLSCEGPRKAKKMLAKSIR
ncbi:MAG: inorganic diphosphatase [Gemmatales bacterium]